MYCHTAAVKYTHTLSSRLTDCWAPVATPIAHYSDRWAYRTWQMEILKAYDRQAFEKYSCACTVCTNFLFLHLNILSFIWIFTFSMQVSTTATILIMGALWVHTKAFTLNKTYLVSSIFGKPQAMCIKGAHWWINTRNLIHSHFVTVNLP